MHTARKAAPVLGLATLAALSLGILSLAALALAARPAAAQDFTFSFTTGSGSTGGAGQTVSGTLSGLTPGANPGPGLTATVTQAPLTALDGDTFSFYNTDTPGDAFTVSADGRSVTFAFAEFLDGSGSVLVFGTNPAADFSLGPITSFPELVGSAGGQEFAFQNLIAPDTFAPAAAVPEPSQTAALGLGALGVLGLMARARRRKVA